MEDAPTSPHVPICVRMLGLTARDTVTVHKKWRPLPVATPPTCFRKLAPPAWPWQLGHEPEDPEIAWSFWVQAAEHRL
eukprot:3740178-Amphidinium_carterae.1